MILCWGTICVTGNCRETHRNSARQRWATGSCCQGQYMSTTDLWLTSVWSVGWSDTGALAFHCALICCVFYWKKNAMPGKTSLWLFLKHSQVWRSPSRTVARSWDVFIQNKRMDVVVVSKAGRVSKFTEFQDYDHEETCWSIMYVS